jgi:hypothetical protein
MKGAQTGVPASPNPRITTYQNNSKIIGNPSIITQGATNATYREPLHNLLAAKQPIHHSEKWAFTRQNKLLCSRKLDNNKNGVRKFYALLSDNKPLNYAMAKPI